MTSCDAISLSVIIPKRKPRSNFNQELIIKCICCSTLEKTNEWIERQEGCGVFSFERCCWRISCLLWSKMVLLRTLFYHCRLKSCWSQEDCGFQIADNYSEPFCENWGQSLFSLSFSLSNGAEENAAAYCWSTIITKRNIIRLPNSFFSGVFGLLLVLSLRFVYKNIYSMYTISFFFLLFRVRKRAAATQWWTRRNFVIIRVSRKWPRWRQQSQRERGREFSRKGLLWLAFTCLCALLHCLRCGPPVSRDTDVVQTTHAHYSAPFF